MELNITSLLYLFFRLSPFIIVSYFSLGSIFNQDIKGLIYLVGVLLSMFVTILVGNSLPLELTFGNAPGESTTRRPVSGVCNMITMGADGSYSEVPLGTSILAYTLSYLVYIIAINKIEKSNIPTLVFLPTILLADILWNFANDCYMISGVFISVICGGLMGWFWAATIDSIKKPELFFLNVGGDRPICYRPSKQLFKCTFINKDPNPTTPPPPPE
jgi:hypothetical protein